MEEVPLTDEPTEPPSTQGFPLSATVILTCQLMHICGNYGVIAIRTIYYYQELLLDKATVKYLSHSFAMVGSFFPIPGALVSDLYFGRFKSVAIGLLLYLSGLSFFVLTTFPQLGMKKIIYVVIAFSIFILGAALINPNLVPLAADQFDPNNRAMRDRYFTLLYFGVNVVSALSTAVTPIIRTQVSCFGDKHCYPLAFGVCAILIMISDIGFFTGRPLYKVFPPSGTAVIDAFRCAGYAIIQRFRASEKRDHWLDYADDKYSPELIKDVKTVASILLLYIPLPMFWALFFQMGTSWTLQSVLMDGRVGSIEILPDQMDLLNPVLVVILLPLFSYGLYPLVGKVNLLKKPLQKMACGGFLGAVAYVFSGIVQIFLENSIAAPPSIDHCDFMMINTLDCQITIQLPDDKESLEKLEYHIFRELEAEKILKGSVTLGDSCSSITVAEPTTAFELDAESKKAYSVAFIADQSGNLAVEQAVQTRERDTKEKSLIRFVYFGELPFPEGELMYSQPLNIGIIKFDGFYSEYIGFWANEECTLCWSLNATEKCANETLLSFEVYKGAIYDALLIRDNSTGDVEMKLFAAVNEDSIHLLYQLPQYIFMTAGEVMLSVTGSAFSYAEAPMVLKSLMRAFWVLNTGLGHMLIVVVEQAKQLLGLSESTGFFVFSILMVLDMMLFAYFAYRYTYRDIMG